MTINELNKCEVASWTKFSLFINIAQSGMKFPVLYGIKCESLYGRRLPSAILLNQVNSLHFVK